MRVKIPVINIMSSLWVLLFILCSGSCIGLIFAKYFDIFYLFYGVLFCLLIKKTVRKKNIKVLTYMLILYIINFVANITGEPNFNAYISYICRMIGTFLLCCFIDLKKFEEIYLRIMFLIALFSLCTFVVVHYLGIGHVTLINGFYMFGPFNMQIYVHRNSGIFWEPGAYQLFLSLALFIKMKNCKWDLFYDKKSFIEVVVLVITILSTQSTTAYIEFALIFIAYLHANWGKMLIKTKVFVFIPMLTLIGLFVTYLLNTKVITDKFTTGNISYGFRTNDIVASIEIIIESIPIIGFGFETSTINNYYRIKGVVQNSVGLLSSIISMGLIYTISYMGFMWEKINMICSNKWDKFTMAALLLLASLTESFYQYPIFFIWIFLCESLNGDLRIQK